jgi:hypothetical protein
MSRPNLKVISSSQGVEPMKKANGFVLQHQSIDSQSWSDDPYCMLVVQFLIRKASYKPHAIKYGSHDIDLDVGEYATTGLKLAKSSAVYGLYKSSKNPDEAAKSAIKTVLKTLEIDGFLAKRIIGKGKDQCTVITIKNWAKFQSKKASVLKPIVEPLAKPQQKPIQTHASCDYQSDAKPIAKPIAEPMANPNNNKGYKQQERIVPNGTCQNPDEFSPVKSQNIPYQEIVNLFGEHFPSLPQPKKLSSARRASIKARHVNDLKSSVENWGKYFNYINTSCSWMISGSYNITFDYLIKQANFLNIWEGAKNDR